MPRMLRILTLSLTPLLFAGASDCQAAEGTSSPAARTAYASAAALQQRGLTDLAKAEWTALLEAHPEDRLAGRARYNLGLCRFQAGEFDEAAEQFARVIESKPEAQLRQQAVASLGIAYFNHAQSENSADSYRAAIKTFDRLARDFPESQQSESAAFYRAKSFVAIEDERAIDALDEFRESYPGSQFKPQVLTLAGELYQQSKRFEKAAESFAQAADSQNYAEADYACQQQAFCLFQADKIDQAVEVYDRLVSRWPESAYAKSARISAAKCLLRIGRAKEAAERLEEVWKPEEGEASHWLVQSMIAADQTDRALEVAKQALAEASNQWKRRLRLDLGNALAMKRGGEQQALVEYEKVASASPRDRLSQQAGYLAAEMALKIGRAKLAIELAERALEGSAAGSLDANLRDVTGEAYLAAEQPAKAALLLGQLVVDYPADPRRMDWVVRQAEASAAAEQWKAVVEHVSRWRDQLGETQAARAMLLSAEALLKQGQPNEALADLNRVITLEPEKALLARALHMRGSQLAKQGNIAQAATDFRRVLGELSEETIAPYSRLALATQLMRTGELHEASSVLKPFEEQGSQGIAGRGNFLHAQVKLQMGEYEAVLELLKLSNATEVELELQRGLALVGLERTNEAIATFDRARLAEGPAKITAQALLELGWQYRVEDRLAESADAFNELAERFPDSAFAAEANYRLGEAKLAERIWAAAAERFALAAANEAASESIAEQALHLLGWAQLKAGNPRSAAETFTRQLKQFPSGKLALDAKLLLAESKFERQQYAEALDDYKSSLDVTLTAEPVRQGLKSLALLHAGQAAGQLGDWQQALQLFERTGETTDNTKPLSETIEYERAWALKQLGRTDEARPIFARLAESGNGVVSARARFMLGELQFAESDLPGAVRTFFQVAYGYGAEQASAEIQIWQAQSLFEAARCLEALDRNDAAVKLYQELLERFPDSEKAPHAQKRLQQAATP